MKVVCRYSSNKDVPEISRTNQNLVSATFDVVVGKEYVVFGQAIFASRLMYLIDPDESCRPNWYPPELFEISDAFMPSSWKFIFHADQYVDDLGAIWGYDELVMNPDHFNGLAERVPDALVIFARQKEAVELCAAR